MHLQSAAQGLTHNRYFWMRILGIAELARGSVRFTGIPGKWERQECLPTLFQLLPHITRKQWSWNKPWKRELFRSCSLSHNPTGCAPFLWLPRLAPSPFSHCTPVSCCQQTLLSYQHLTIKESPSPRSPPLFEGSPYLITVRVWRLTLPQPGQLWWSVSAPELLWDKVKTWLHCVIARPLPLPALLPSLPLLWKCESVTHLTMSDSLDPMDCSPPGSCVHRILQARILEWVAIPFSRGSSWPRLIRACC